jgi:hypothetical protein
MSNSRCMFAPSVAERGAFFFSVMLSICTGVMLVLDLGNYC